MTNRDGASALETAIIAALVALALGAALQKLGPGVSAALNSFVGAMADEGQEDGGSSQAPRGRP